MAYIPYSPQLDCKYTLTAPNGLRAVLNDQSDPDYVGAVTDITGLDSAEVRESALDIVEADGGSHGTFYFGRRPITITVVVFGAASQSERDIRIAKLAAASKACLRSDGILAWRNAPTLSNAAMQTYVRLQQPFRTSGNWVKSLQLQLVSQYAQLFSTTLNLSPSTASGTGVTVENKGDSPAYPLLRIAGGSTNPTVTKTGGPVLRTTGLTLASGETIEIDTLNHTARFIAGARNGQSGNRYIDFTNSGWPTLSMGNNTLTLAGSGSLVVAWRDTWS